VYREAAARIVRFEKYVTLHASDRLPPGDSERTAEEFSRAMTVSAQQLRAFLRTPAVQAVVAAPEFQAMLNTNALYRNSSDPLFRETFIMIELCPEWAGVLVHV